MDASLFLPPEITAWLLRYGLALATAVVALVVIALAVRPFVLWYTGRSEELERLKRIDESTRKAVFELELLNETLSIPVKKAAQKAKAAEREKAAEEPLVVSQETKENFLKALERSRQTQRENPED
jgi:hypothetical protein